MPVIATPVGSFPEQLSISAQNVAVNSIGAGGLATGINQLTARSSMSMSEETSDSVVVGWSNYISVPNNQIQHHQPD